jgi:hypothetical protein
MLELGLQVSVVAPLAALALARRLPRVRPLAAWSIFVAAQWLFHASPLLALAERSLAAHAVLHAVLLATAVLFWAPVVQGLLDGAERTLYLFLALPAVDGIALWFMVDGRQDLGVAMIVGMLPLSAAAVLAVWSWLVEEERTVRALERAR